MLIEKEKEKRPTKINKNQMLIKKEKGKKPNKNQTLIKKEKGKNQKNQKNPNPKRTEI